jgi:hypothetical protein
MMILCINIKRQEMEQQVENLQKRLAGLGFGVAMGYSWSAHPQTRSQIAEAEVLMSNDKLKLMHGTTVMKRMEQSVIDEGIWYICSRKWISTQGAQRARRH